MEYTLVDYNTKGLPANFAAGLKAEQQMAYILKSFFKQEKDLCIINGLRLEIDKEINVQFDHLLFHKKGVFIIESKSVSTKIKITQNQEWLRLENNHYKGIPSPINQLKRQAKLLREFLQKNRELLRDEEKFLFFKKQGGFINMKIDPIVAISQNGIITGFRNTDIPILKADEVPNYINIKLDEYFSNNLLKKLSDVDWILSDDEFLIIIDFLIKHHKPFNYNKKGSKYYCFACKKPISYSEAKYCFERKKIFGGKAYCISCQQKITNRKYQ
ncbi:nuclease-related domain-containing protein [Hippea jasoniae]|uniref:nuclease-related domain-containing protein n=1 Tax=Hippea jasoniae TaxID=944479 RepID=UPI0005536A87|nr:nuclease-related domain-containing protein [Hippea jasoniae]